jgi:hypothetical protein
MEINHLHTQVLILKIEFGTVMSFVLPLSLLDTIDSRNSLRIVISTLSVSARAFVSAHCCLLVRIVFDQHWYTLEKN